MALDSTTLEDLIDQKYAAMIAEADEAIGAVMAKLRELKLVWANENGKLAFDERLNARAKDARVVLGRELRHTIEKVSPDNTRTTGEIPALPAEATDKAE